MKYLKPTKYYAVKSVKDDRLPESGRYFVIKDYGVGDHKNADTSYCYGEKFGSPFVTYYLQEQSDYIFSKEELEKVRIKETIDAMQWCLTADMTIQSKEIIQKRILELQSQLEQFKEEQKQKP